MTMTINRQRGISLIELMIASVISILIISSVLTIYINSQHSSRTQSLTRQIQENGRYAIQILAEDIRMAKYYGMNVMPSTIDDETFQNLPIEINYKCGDKTWASNIDQPIFASNNANPYQNADTNCIPDDNYVDGTDVLVVRHAESEAITADQIEQNKLYLYTSLTDGEIFRAIQDDAINSDTLMNLNQLPREVYPFTTNVYYIRPCSIMDGNSCSDDNIPTLVRKSLGADDVTTEPLIEYIEDLQVVFGIDTTGDLIVDQYVTANDIAVSDWNDVLSARIEVLARSPNTVAGYNNPASYTIGSETKTTKDGYYRKVFSATIFLRNPSLDNGPI